MRDILSYYKTGELEYADACSLEGWGGDDQGGAGGAPGSSAELPDLDKATKNTDGCGCQYVCRNAAAEIGDARNLCHGCGQIVG